MYQTHCKYLLDCVWTNARKRVCKTSLSLFPIFWLACSSAYVVDISNIYYWITPRCTLPVWAVHFGDKLTYLQRGTSRSIIIGPTEFKWKCYLKKYIKINKSIVIHNLNLIIILIYLWKQNGLRYWAVIINMFWFSSYMKKNWKRQPKNATKI